MTLALGVDVGTVRLGLAASDPTGQLASAVATLPVRDLEGVWRRIEEERVARGALTLVIGLPRQLDGREGPAAEAARRFAVKARERTSMRVEFFDERFTTVQAERALIEQGVRRKQRREAIDSHAAALLLQAWLDARRIKAAASSLPKRRDEGARGRLALPLVALLAVVAFGGGVAAFGRSQLEPPNATHGTPVAIQVVSGEGQSAVAEDLERHGLVRSAFWFGLLARVRGLEGHLHPGRYLLDHGMGASAVIAKLRGDADQAVRRVALAEGLTAEEMGARLESARVGITAREYLAEVHGGRFTAPFAADRAQGIGLDGFLFPDTYDVPAGTTAHGFVQMQLDDFGRRGLPALKGSTTGLSTYQLVVLASVVEREARADIDRPKVAGVITNRLRDDMALEVDASVTFGLGVSGREPTADEKRRDTPYNTYIHAGLPPSPISNPGTASLAAAAQPAVGPYLFYVSDGCGHNHYAITNAEHERNVARYVGQPCPA